jgi:hypothetical protein
MKPHRSSSPAERYNESAFRGQKSQLWNQHRSSAARRSAVDSIQKALRCASSAERCTHDAAIDQDWLQPRRDCESSSAEETSDSDLIQKQILHVKRRAFAEEIRSVDDLAQSNQRLDRSRSTAQKGKQRPSFSNNSTLTFSDDREVEVEREHGDLHNSISTPCTESALDDATGRGSAGLEQEYVELMPRFCENPIKSRSCTPLPNYQSNRSLIAESLAALWVDQQLNHAGSTKYGSSRCAQVAILAEKLSNSDVQLDVLELDGMELLDHDQELAESVLRDPDAFATEVMDHVLCQLNSNDLYRSYWNSSSKTRANAEILQRCDHGELDVTEPHASENTLPARGSRLWIRLTSVPIPLLPVEALHRLSAGLTSSSAYSFDDMSSSSPRSQLVHVYGIVYAISTIRRTYPALVFCQYRST